MSDEWQVQYWDGAWGGFRGATSFGDYPAVSSKRTAYAQARKIAAGCVNDREVRVLHNGVTVYAVNRGRGQL